MNKKTTSESLASLASEVLRDNNSSNIQKTLAGSVLSQRDKNKQTGSELEEKASEVLRSEKYNSIAKQLAASLLSQSCKER